MNALDFLDFILDKHHEGIDPSENNSHEYIGNDEVIDPVTDGCELVSNVDK